MKLYIATTSLNFDTIMSTESVSPASFYFRRGFGIKMFYDKASFIHPNSILLMDACPLFSLDNKEVEHRPMVIEIDDSDYPGAFEKVKEGNGCDIYRATRTLYLSPLSCKILFASPRDLSFTLSKSESILESKYILYEKTGAISVIDKRYETVKINQKTFEGIRDTGFPDDSCIRKDFLIDRAKGFIVSYMIGASKALTPESVKLQRLVRDIKNCIYSLRTNDNKAAAKQSPLRELTTEANALASQLDPVRKEIKKRLRDYLDKTNASQILNGSDEKQVIEWLKVAGLYQALYNKVAAGMKVVDYALLASDALNASEETFDKVMDYFQSYTDSIMKKENVEVPVKGLFRMAEDYNCIECADPAIAPESARKLEIFYNLFKDPSFTTSNIRPDSAHYVAEAGAALFGSVDGSQEEKDYFNALLDNLEHARKFDIKMSGSLALQSLAAFMKAPDSDIEKLSALLVSNEISDSRIAYGLWGLFYGYSCVPRNLYNDLVSSLGSKDTVDFIEGINKLFFQTNPENKQGKPKKSKGLLGRALDKITEVFEDTQSSQESDYATACESPATKVSKQKDNRLSEVQATLFSSLEDEDFEMEKRSQPSMPAVPPLPDDDDLPGEYAEVFGELEPLILEAKVKKDKDLFYTYYRSQVRKVCNSAVSFPALVSGLDQIPVQYNKSGWTDVKKNLKAKVRDVQQRQIDSRTSETSKPSSVKTKSIIRDSNAPEVVRQFANKSIEDRDVLGKIYSGFKYFHKGWQPGEYYDKTETMKDNSSVINRWVSWCFSEKNQYNRLTPDFRFVIDNLARQLKQYYGE